MDSSVLQQLNGGSIFLVCGAIIAVIAVICVIFIIRAGRAGSFPLPAVSSLL